MIRAAVLALAISVLTPIVLAQKEPTIETTSGVLSRAPDNVPHPTMSPQERELMRDRFEEFIEHGQGEINENPPSEPGRPLVADPETVLVENPAVLSAGTAASTSPSANHGRLGAVATSNPGDLVIGKKVSNPNPVGHTPVVEPNVSNMSLSVFYLTNDVADYSVDGGTTFTPLTIPGGPSDAPNFCCDQTVVFDPGRSTWFWSRLYTATGGGNSIVEISVIKNPPTVACTYVYDPGGTSNMFVDYPQLGLSDNELYLSTSESQGGSWLRSRMLRMDLDKFLDCPPSVGFRAIGFLPSSKRMWTPVRGAKGIMYWANLEDPTHLRIWTWPETDTAATSVLKQVQTTTFADSDCRGGANNQDWMKSKGWHIWEGFLRGALARGGTDSACPDCGRLQFYWNAAKDAKHKQAYVRSAVFDLPGLSLLAEPNVHNPDFCYGYADVHPNARGDLGVTIAFGGKDGGNGRALASGVAIEDEYTTKYKLNTVYVTTNGTDMPSSNNKSWDQRYGDYLSVKPHDPCPLWWVAGNYALSGGGGPANVVANYIEFGRQRDKNCWDRWNQVIPKVLP